LNEADFLAVFSRLLSDGPLRDEFAQNPVQTVERLGVLACELDALASLSPCDLEFQAQVLLRKRFDAARRLIPLTCARLGGRAWPLFHGCARERPLGEDVRDAHAFCEFLQTQMPAAVARSELNRLQFALGQKRLAMHFVCDLQIKDRVRCGLQLFVRVHRSAWREHVIYLSL